MDEQAKDDGKKHQDHSVRCIPKETMEAAKAKSKQKKKGKIYREIRWKHWCTINQVIYVDMSSRSINKIT